MAPINLMESMLAKALLAVEIIPPDPLPGLCIERGPEDKGVGFWVPSSKHRLLCEYLDGTKHAWKKWDNRVLLDPFCGPGRIQVKTETYTREGGTLIACRQMALNNVPFTHVFTGDIDSDRANACDARLKASGFPSRSFVGPASETVPRMVESVRQIKNGSTLCFAYVDPYNLALLDFDLLKKISTLRVDLTTHFSTMDLRRNVEMEFDADRARFDSVAPGWRDAIPVDKLPKSELVGEFFRYWLKQVSDLNFTTAREMPLIPNDSGHEIYRLVFFARHALPLRIWADVARGPQQSFGF